jgi:hypothetical protein
MARAASIVVAAFFVVAGAASASPALTQQPPAAGVPGRPSPQMPARDNATPRTGTARIRGHVADAETGAPLRRAQVRINSPELRENRVTTTDAQGAYEFVDLPAGRYTVMVNKGSYMGLQYGQTRPNQPGRPIEILDGQTMEKIDVALPHGSIITGRVLDEFGEPVADVQVMPMRYTFMQGQRRLMPTGRASQTNDIGEYRLFGLAPGQYYISAMLRNFTFGDSDDRSGYAPTYYPGTPNAAEAQRIKIDVGQTLSDINLALIPTRTAKVTGTAYDVQGRPLTQGGVMAMPRNQNGPMMFGPMGNGQIKPDGSFAISGLAPGDYILRANTMTANGQRPEFAMAEVSVGGADVNGVRLTVRRPITVSGRVVFADAAAAQSLQVTAVRIMAAPANPDDSMMMMGGGAPAAVKEDFTFELQVQPIKALIRLAGSPPGNWRIRSVRQSGIDVIDSGIDFSSGNDVSNLEVELINRASEISGLVTNARGEAVKEYTVMVFSQDRDQWIGNTRYRSTARGDQEGRFKIRALPPGRYYAIALDYLDQNEAGDPELLDRIHTRATMFTLGEDETKVLDLKVQQGT